MQPTKRAILYIRRKKKFSALLFLLLVLLFSAGLMGGIMVRALQDTHTSLRQTFAGSLYISTNWGIVGTQPETVPGFQMLDDDMVKKLRTIEGIIAVNATATNRFASDDLKLIPGSGARYLKDTDPSDVLEYKQSLAFSKSTVYSSVSLWLPLIVVSVRLYQLALSVRLLTVVHAVRAKGRASARQARTFFFMESSGKSFFPIIA